MDILKKRKEHMLKTDPAVFQDVLDGKKTFEIRFNDRGYQIGDLVVLKETKFTGQQMKSGQTLVYTGREIQKRISYVLSGYGLQDDWVILGIQDIEAANAVAVPEGFEQAYSEIFSPIIKQPYPRLENGDYKYIEIDQGWKLWQAATAQAVPEGFILIPAKCFKFFSHDGDNYEVHDTLVEAKHEADSAIEHFRERLADQLSDPRSDGNFQDIGYGLILGHSNYSIDHVVTQDDIDQGNYPYEVGTEILSLFLVEAQEQSHETN